MSANNREGGGKGELETKKKNCKHLYIYIYIYIYVSHKGELELVEFVVQCTAPLETSLV